MMNFSLFFERIAWGALAAIVLYASSQLREMTASVQALNTNVSILLEKSKNADERQQEIKQSLRDLEQRVNQLEKRR